MSEVKHTPGPWLTQWEHGGDESIWSRDGGMHMIATCHAEDGRVIPAKANARLIAAAPDLFEAGTELQDARKAQNADPSAENASRVRDASDAFDAALSKATTQQDGR